MTESTTRLAKIEDVNAIKEIIDSSELFPSEMVDEMMANYFSDSASKDKWLVKIVENKPVAVCFFSQEKLTNETYNIYLIAVHQNYQRSGIGKEMINYVENYLKENNGRIIIVETSGLPEFHSARQFYTRCGYHQEAVIRDFYDTGDDKIIFWKKI